MLDLLIAYIVASYAIGVIIFAYAIFTGDYNGFAFLFWTTVLAPIVGPPLILMAIIFGTLDPAVASIFAVPYAIAVLPVLYRWRRRRIREAWATNNLCLNCGYDIRASKLFCPECGWWFPSKKVPQKIQGISN